MCLSLSLFPANFSYQLSNKDKKFKKTYDVVADNNTRTGAKLSLRMSEPCAITGSRPRSNHAKTSELHVHKRTCTHEHNKRIQGSVDTQSHTSLEHVLDPKHLLTVTLTPK